MAERRGLFRRLLDMLPRRAEPAPEPNPYRDDIGPVSEGTCEEEPEPVPPRRQQPEPMQQLPAEPVRRSRRLWDEMAAEAETSHQRARQGGSNEEHLMRLRKQIADTKARCDHGEDLGPRLRELRRDHHDRTGADGG